jgi:hypothetical protein
VKPYLLFVDHKERHECGRSEGEHFQFLFAKDVVVGAGTEIATRCLVDDPYQAGLSSCMFQIDARVSFEKSKGLKIVTLQRITPRVVALSCIFSILFLVQNSFALPSARFLGPTFSRLLQHESVLSCSGRALAPNQTASLPEVLFRIRLRRLGVVVVRLEQLWCPIGALGSLAYLRGSYEQRRIGKQGGVSAVIRRSETSATYQVRLALDALTPRRKKNIFFDITLDGEVASGSVSVRQRRAPASLHTEETCGTTSEFAMAPSAAHLRSALHLGAEQSLRILDLTVISDSYFQSKLGKDAAQTAYAVVNTANALYMDELGIGLRLQALNELSSRTDPFSRETNPMTLLQEASFDVPYIDSLPASDVYHIFTGRDFDGSSAGVAWIGTACKDDVNIGMSQYVPNLTVFAMVFAHELGHNLGAHHDPYAPNAPPTVMAPTLLGGSGNFSEQSKREIGGFLSTASCLQVSTSPPSNPGTLIQEPTPTPIPIQPPSPPPISAPSTSDAPSLSTVRGEVVTSRKLLRRLRRRRGFSLRNTLLTELRGIDLTLEEFEQLAAPLSVKRENRIAEYRTILGKLYSKKSRKVRRKSFVRKVERGLKAQKRLLRVL